MMKIDRGEFWGSYNEEGQYLFNPKSYEDRPQQINFNVVISAPHLHAHVLELL
jgi:protein-L-isoaspartate O-methyltransferase